MSTCLPDGIVVSCAAPWLGGGLGRHLAEVVEGARGQGTLCRYFASTVPADDPDGEAVGLWWWLPWVAQYTPVRFSQAWRAYLGSEAFDRAVASRLPLGGETVVGFAGMALHTFRRARQLGYRKLQLESPTAHIARVRWLYDLAYRQYPMERDCIHSRLVRKILAEYVLADEIVVGSEYSRESFLAAGIPGGKIARRTLTVDPRFRPAPEARPDHFHVLYVGSLTVIKGVPLLLEAFQRVSDPGAQLTLVGGSGSRGMRRLLDRARQDPRVRVTVGDPLPYLQTASVFVHPSYQDGFGYAPMEALACGVPVIVTTETGMKEHVRDGENGFIVPAGDPGRVWERLMDLKEMARDGT